MATKYVRCPASSGAPQARNLSVIPATEPARQWVANRRRAITRRSLVSRTGGVLGLLLTQLSLAADDAARCHISIQASDSFKVTVAAELALTDAQHAQGLMYRRELPPGHGMLFDFGEARPITMWMKNTLIPLDMLFFAADGRLTYRHNDARPGSLALIAAPSNVRYVLEINAGEARDLEVTAPVRLETPSLAACIADLHAAR